MPSEPFIHLAFATNGHYVPLALCCLTSLLLHASRRDNLRFVLLSDGLTEQELGLFQTALSHFGCDQEQLSVIPLKERLEAMDLPLWNGGKTTWLRLLLPELLPKVSHVLYTDVDVLWLCDVQAFAPWMQLETSIAGTPDGAVVGDTLPKGISERLATQCQWFARNGLPFERTRYLNSGILVMHLEKLRKGNLSTVWPEFLKAHPNPPAVDQEIFNGLFHSDLTLLPEWCNRMSGVPGVLTLPAVLHYAGRRHPWHAKAQRRLFPLDDLLLLGDFWETVMEPLYGEALAPYRFARSGPWGWWKMRWWPALQRRFPGLYRYWHRHLIARAKTSEAKAEKLKVVYWEAHWFCASARIPARQRKTLRAQWKASLG